jgi:hypothetical protein
MVQTIEVENMGKKEKDWRRSERVKTGHTILLPTKFRDNPTCPHHSKRGKAKP